MGRAVGFSLQVLGTDASIKEIERVEKRLLDLGNKLKAASANTNTGTSGSSGGSKPPTKELKEYNLETAIARKEKAELKKAIDLEAQAFVNLKNNIPTDSLIGMRVELRKLDIELDKLSKTDYEGEIGKKLLITQQNTFKEVQAREEAQGRFSRNVGNYRENVTRLIPILESLGAVGLKTNQSLAAAFREDNEKQVKELTILVDKLGKEFLELRSDINKAVEAEAKFNDLANAANKLSNAARNLKTSSTSLKDGILSVGNIASGGLIAGGIIGATSALTAGYKRAFTAAAEFTDVQADVRKTTGLTKDEIIDLSQEFKKFNTRTATTELLKIAAIAGQLGVDGKQEVSAFTKAIDVLVVALGDELSGGAERIANDLGRLSNIMFGVTTDGKQLSENILFLGNTLNVLSASGSATSEAIIELGSRIGRSLIPLGASAEEVLALAATFDELNIRAEQGATAINNLVKDIGADTKLFSSTLGIDQDELRKQFNTSPLEAFQTVLNKILTISGGDKTKILNLLKELRQSGEGVSSVFLQLSTNSELYDKNLKNSQAAIKSTTSLFNEFAVKNETLAGVSEKLNKKLSDLGTNPRVIKFFEIMVSGATALLSLFEFLADAVGHTFDRFGTLFDSLSTKVSGRSFSIINSIKGISSASILSSESNYIVAKSVNDLNSFLIKEQAIIDTSIKIIKDENASTLAKEKAVESLTSKYPGLVTEQKLLLASDIELNEIQKTLTNTLRTQTFERIKIKALEQLETKRINNEIRIAELQNGAEISTREGLLLGFSKAGGGRGSLIKSLEANNKEVEKAIQNIEVVFGGVAERLGIKNEEVKTSLTDTTNTIKDNVDIVSDGLKVLGDKAEKSLDAQLKRIAELEALIAEKRADLITNQFDKQIADITNKANQQLEKLKLQKAEIENKKIPGAKDNEELKKIEEANTAINEALIRQKVIINTERQRAIDLFKQELQAARIELANILSELSANKTSSAIGTQEFEEQRKTNANKLEFDKQILDLDISLREKKISQEEYNKQVSELELKLATDNESIVKQSNENLAILYAQDFETQKEFINQKREFQRQDAINSADNQASAVIDDPNLDTFQKADKLEQIQKTLAAKLLKIDGDTLNEQEGLRQKTLALFDALGIKLFSSHKATEEAKTATTEEEEEKRRRLRELAIEKGFETAQAISNTLFEIDNARDQQRADENKTRIEQEYSNRIKLAEGNAGEISRLEKEKDNKIKQIEKEAAERRKKSAINQTIIDGLLAIGKIFATIPPPGSFILAAAQAVITGLALIKIKNTPAGAKGGWTQEITGAKGGRAPKDHTGHAPAGPINTHMDEFLSPPEQTRKYSDIFQWMEEDRKSLLSGQGGTLDKRLKAKYAALSTDIVKNSTIPFKAMPRPIIVNVKSNNQVIQAEWSEEHIDKIADRIAERTSQKTSQAIFAGTVEGSKIATLNERREQSRLQRKYN